MNLLFHSIRCFLAGREFKKNPNYVCKTTFCTLSFFFFNSTYSFIPAFIFSVTIETTVYSYKLIETSILMEKTHDRL